MWVLGPVPDSSAEEEKVLAEWQSHVKSTLCDLSRLPSVYKDAFSSTQTFSADRKQGMDPGRVQVIP